MADEASRRENATISAYLLFWLGVLLIFVPIALRTLASDVNPLERLSLIVFLGLALYMVKVLASPSSFTFVDEFVHMRNTHAILGMRHLFTWNPLLDTAAYYPGLAALTAGLVALTGMSMFAAGLLLIGIARVLVCAFFYLVFESVTHSGRAAAAASLMYMANPMFLFWSSTFTYENLALPLGAFVVWWIGKTRNCGGLKSMAVAAAAIIAVTVTHHIVGFALAGLLAAWWLAEHVGCRATKAARRQVGVMAIVAWCATLTWFFVVARPAPTYLLVNNLLPALQDTFSVIVGHSAPRKLYALTAMTPPAWEPIAGFAAVFVLLALLPAGLLRARRSCRRAPAAIATALAIGYPLSLAPRLASHGVAISGRSSEFVYTGLGCVIGLLFAAAAGKWYAWRTNLEGERDDRRHRWRDSFIPTSVAAGLATVVFIGNVTVGVRFFERLPEEAHPQGFERTLKPDVVAASTWALRHLGANQIFGTDVIDAEALATYGEQDLANPPRLSSIFFAESVNSDVVKNIRSLRLRYVLVNWRMTSEHPPIPDYYVDPDEPEAFHHSRAFSVPALEKFSSDPCIQMIYDAGPIQIYDLTQIERGTCS
ncbi:MAG: hypothetical protein JO082_03000 [Mycobacterium sp.]|nr:hypothetical protein [Mycobacterium sp.]